MLNLQSLLSWEVVGLSVAIVVVVRILKATKLLKNGDWARNATIVLSALLSGADISEPESVALTSAVLMLSTAIHELISLAEKKFVEYNENKVKG